MDSLKYAAVGAGAYRAAMAHPDQVPYTVIADEGLDGLARALRDAHRLAIDTEVPIDGPRQGQVRVVSIAGFRADGPVLPNDAGLAANTFAFVVDCARLDPTALAPLLEGVSADAWNANFDARVIDAGVYQTDEATAAISWWDAQFADALLYQGQRGFNWYHSLAWASEEYLGVVAEGKGTIQLSYTFDAALTERQCRYAANDAIETLWIGSELRRRVEAASLSRVCALEMGARGFIDRMERAGIPVNWQSWHDELARYAEEQRTVLTELAAMTGGGQGTLFDAAVEPSWNPASDAQVKTALNTYATEAVTRWAQTHKDETRLLQPSDSVNAGVLADIGGPLATAILAYRRCAKILTTYGESMASEAGPDGRLHSRYIQIVGTNTGRLASRNPNAQNLPAALLTHFRPAEANRVFVHADLSQAELRHLAQVADDRSLIAAFAADQDVHVTTAATMFGFDADRLRVDDPQRFATLRQTAKALNFGIAYGQGAAALGQTLTRQGTPTTLGEARVLLDQYKRTYPGVTAWADASDDEVRALTSRANDIDWPMTMRLLDLTIPVRDIRRSFRDGHGRWPTREEIIDAWHDDPGRSDVAPEGSVIGWVLRVHSAVAVDGAGHPIVLTRRTRLGRRIGFSLSASAIVYSATKAAGASRAPSMQTVRSNFAARSAPALPRHRPWTSDELERELDALDQRRAFLSAIAAARGDDEMYRLLRWAAADQIASLTTAWRNAPIQGGVADTMLDAFARIGIVLRAFPGAEPVQSVHDSVVIECDRLDAEHLAERLREALEAAMLASCPDVRPRADVDIRTSLADDSVVAVVPGSLGLGTSI